MRGRAPAGPRAAGGLEPQLAAGRRRGREWSGRGGGAALRAVLWDAGPSRRGQGARLRTALGHPPRARADGDRRGGPRPRERVEDGRARFEGARLALASMAPRPIERPEGQRLRHDQTILGRGDVQLPAAVPGLPPRAAPRELARATCVEIKFQAPTPSTRGPDSRIDFHTAHNRPGRRRARRGARRPARVVPQHRPRAIIRGCGGCSACRGRAGN